MAQLDTEDRNRLHNESFAWIDDKGERHLPINDEAHVRNAIARFDQTEFDEPGAKEPRCKPRLSDGQRSVNAPAAAAVSSVRM